MKLGTPWLVAIEFTATGSGPTEMRFPDGRWNSMTTFLEAPEQNEAVILWAWVKDVRTTLIYWYLVSFLETKH